MEDEPVRELAADPIFAHLRTQDQAIKSLREELAPIIEIISNLRGFSVFCKRWGARFNRALGWLAKVGAPLLTVYVFFRDPINAFFKRWFN